MELPKLLQAVQECGIQYAQGYFIGAVQPHFLTEVPEQVLDANYLYVD